jgi:plastocyanin
MLVRAGDQWLLNYMLHNQVTRPENVFVTYEIDYVPRAKAERRGIQRVVPLWLDVLNDERPYYPVFNVQRGFGKLNRRSGRSECTYPRDRCAAFDPYGNDQPGNGRGYDWVVPKRFAGTLVGMGGHVHPGGLRDEVSLLRNVGGKTLGRRLFTSEAVYYDRRGPVSWDMSMTVTPRNSWKVRIEPGDTIRLNAVYDAQSASWYEGMGIVMAWVAPGDESGVEPFKKVRVKVKRRRGAGGPRYRYRYVHIPTKGPVTHGHLAENDNHGGEDVRPLPSKPGPLVSSVSIAGFGYFPGDLSRARQEGIPRVKAGGRLTFRNVDSASGIWHSVTTCKPPCSGRTGISYPLADALPPLDSLELGYGVPANVQPAAGTATYTIEPRKSGLAPGRTYTYFCRIHPFMRGAFKVVE